jgi:2-polyprenyl-3-methyl-5-hydroxy-6-metoxy-1,4-benzoquinol methylase
MNARLCRFCKAPLTESMCDLGMQPPSNAFISSEHINSAERFYPLQAFVCGRCYLVQVDEFESPADIFSDYAYFSSFSTTWVQQALEYAIGAIERLSLNESSLVVELASNDGYLLQHFRERGVQVLGIDPAANCALEARSRGIETLVDFFGTRVAAQVVSDRGRADLIVANNVLAHVPDLNDFVAGISALLAARGVATIEVPHLLKLIEKTEYDTIYHEHFSYFSLTTAQTVFAAHGLDVVDVDELHTHGGSIRMWVRHTGVADVAARVGDVLARESRAGLDHLETYQHFSRAVIDSKISFWEFLIDAKRSGKVVAAYGAAAKGNTLLNYCGAREDFVAYVVDRNPYKQGRFLPGSHIPVKPVEFVAESRPDYLLILPWNLVEEISAEMAGIRDWGGRFVTAIPSTKVF